MKKRQLVADRPSKRVTGTWPALTEQLLNHIQTYSELTELVYHIDQSIRDAVKERKANSPWEFPEFSFKAWRFVIQRIQGNPQPFAGEYRGKTWSLLFGELPDTCGPILDALDALSRVSGLPLLTSSDRMKIKRGLLCPRLENTIADIYFSHMECDQDFLLSRELWHYAFFCILEQPNAAELIHKFQVYLDSGKSRTKYAWSQVVKDLIENAPLTEDMKMGAFHLMACIDGSEHRMLKWSIQRQLYVLPTSRPFEKLAPEKATYRPYPETDFIIGALAAGDNPAWLYVALIQFRKSEFEVPFQLRRWKEKHQLLTGHSGEEIIDSTNAQLTTLIAEANRAYSNRARASSHRASLPCLTQQTSWRSSFQQHSQLQALKSLTVFLCLGLGCDSPILEAVYYHRIYHLSKQPDDQAHRNPAPQMPAAQVAQEAFDSSSEDDSDDSDYSD